MEAFVNYITAVSIFFGAAHVGSVSIYGCKQAKENYYPRSSIDDTCMEPSARTSFRRIRWRAEDNRKRYSSPVAVGNDISD
eukprot:1609599-Pleurochrysis_carterae.AAC.1